MGTFEELKVPQGARAGNPRVIRVSGRNGAGSDRQPPTHPIRRVAMVTLSRLAKMSSSHCCRLPATGKFGGRR